MTYGLEFVSGQFTFGQDFNSIKVEPLEDGVEFSRGSLEDFLCSNTTKDSSLYVTIRIDS